MADHIVTQVTLAIAMRGDANAVTVAEDILPRVEALHGSLIPDSVRVDITRDYGDTAQHKADKLLANCSSPRCRSWR